MRLFTAVFVPDDNDVSGYPILLSRTSEAVTPYGIDCYSGRFAPNQEFRDAGYIFVWQEVRGSHRSEGHFESPPGALDRPINESTDAADTIEWLVKNVRPNNGRVGVWGDGEASFYALAAARSQHPALAAVSIRSPTADGWFDDGVHRGGALALRSIAGRLRRIHPDDGALAESVTSLSTLGYLEETLGGMPEAEALLHHPDFDDYWRVRVHTPWLRDVSAPTLMLGNWDEADHVGGTIAAYRALEEQNPHVANSLVMGPWTSAAIEPDQLAIAQFAFFEHRLRVGPDPLLPEAYVFEAGTPRWRRFDHWPPHGTKSLTLYLEDTNRLGNGKPASAYTYDEFISDPAQPVPDGDGDGHTGNSGEDQRFASRRADVVSYTTPTLSYELTLAGPIDVELYISVTGTDADWIAKLIDVSAEDGRETLVRAGVLRSRYRDDPSSAHGLVAGERTRVNVRLDDVLYTFKRGDRLELQVQSTWFPSIDSNPQTFVASIPRAKRSDYTKATHRIYRGNGAASAIHAQVLRQPDDLQRLTDSSK